MPGPQPCHCIPFIFCIVGGGLTPPRGVGDAAPYNTIRRASHYRKRPRRPGGRPPYIPLYHIPWGGLRPRPIHTTRRGRACPARSLAITTRILCIVGSKPQGLCVTALPPQTQNNQPATSRRQVVLVPFLLRKGTNPRLVKITSGQSPQPRRPAPAGPAGSARPSGR